MPAEFLRYSHLITTECRTRDPSNAALIAAKLYHFVAVADKVYVMKGRVALFSQAVHFARKSISANAEEAAKAGTSAKALEESALSPGWRDEDVI